MRAARECVPLVARRAANDAARRASAPPRRCSSLRRRTRRRTVPPRGLAPGGRHGPRRVGRVRRATPPSPPPCRRRAGLGERTRADDAPVRGPRVVHARARRAGVALADRATSAAEAERAAERVEASSNDFSDFEENVSPKLVSGRRRAAETASVLPRLVAGVGRVGRGDGGRVAAMADARRARKAAYSDEPSAAADERDAPAGPRRTSSRRCATRATRCERRSTTKGSSKRSSRKTVVSERSASVCSRKMIRHRRGSCRRARTRSTASRWHSSRRRRDASKLSAWSARRLRSSSGAWAPGGTPSGAPPSRPPRRASRRRRARPRRRSSRIRTEYVVSKNWTRASGRRGDEDGTTTRRRSRELSRAAMRALMRPARGRRRSPLRRGRRSRSAAPRHALDAAEAFLRRSRRGL